MKNLFLLASAIFIFSISKAQEVSENDLPETVLDNFKEEFDNASNSSWEKEDSTYSVSFEKSDDKEINLIYDHKGELIEKFESVNRAELPATLVSYLEENYPLQGIEKSWIKEKGLEVIYKIQLEEIVTGGGSISGTSIGIDKDAFNEDLEADSARITHNNYQYESTERFLYFDEKGLPTIPPQAKVSANQQQEEITTTISKKSKKTTSK